MHSIIFNILHYIMHSIIFNILRYIMHSIIFYVSRYIMHSIFYISSIDETSKRQSTLKIYSLIRDCFTRQMSQRVLWKLHVGCVTNSIESSRRCSEELSEPFFLSKDLASRRIPCLGQFHSSVSCELIKIEHPVYICTYMAYGYIDTWYDFAVAGIVNV